MTVTLLTQRDAEIAVVHEVKMLKQSVWKRPVRKEATIQTPLTVCSPKSWKTLRDGKSAQNKKGWKCFHCQSNVSLDFKCCLNRNFNNYKINMHDEELREVQTLKQVGAQGIATLELQKYCFSCRYTEAFASFSVRHEMAQTNGSVAGKHYAQAQNLVLEFSFHYFRIAWDSGDIHEINATWPVQFCNKEDTNTVLFTTVTAGSRPVNRQRARWRPTNESSATCQNRT